MARFWRMNGYNVFYPMGYDDNGLPTERLVEKREGITVSQVGRATSSSKSALQVSEEAEKGVSGSSGNVWDSQSIGATVIAPSTRRRAKPRNGRFLISTRRIWPIVARHQPSGVPTCRTAIAQAELNDLERESEFVTLCVYSGGWRDPCRLLPRVPNFCPPVWQCLFIPTITRYNRTDRLAGECASYLISVCHCWGIVKPILRRVQAR